MRKVQKEAYLFLNKLQQFSLGLTPGFIGVQKRKRIQNEMLKTVILIVN